MKFQSTRNVNRKATPSEAIFSGIAPDGGLYVPEEFPALSMEGITAFAGKPYYENAARVLGAFFTDFTEEEILACTKNAYLGKFENDIPAPLTMLGENCCLIELWHGPTCAFKDIALQLLPYLLAKAAEKCGGGKKSVILTATSGDTGKAALEGFCNVPGTEIFVFYPEDGVSSMQKLQMASQKGENVHVRAVKGNFDDTQTAVKRIFTDEAVKAALAEKGMAFSSANSINIGRLVPQIVYYLEAYAKLAADGKIKAGDEINIAVPSGNFGDILAAYYAKKMGLPVHKLICASNSNHVLTDFIRTGVYDRNRRFYTTVTPSMDILISSNLERLLFDYSDKDAAVVPALMKALAEKGVYEVSGKVKAGLQTDFWAGWCSEEDTFRTVGEVFADYHYLCDTHTAVALEVCRCYRQENGDRRMTVTVSTASPYKFPASVLKAVTGETTSDEFAAAEKLEQISGMLMPKSLGELKNAEIRFTGSSGKEDLKEYVLSTIGG